MAGKGSKARPFSDVGEFYDNWDDIDWWDKDTDTKSVIDKNDSPDQLEFDFE